MADMLQSDRRSAIPLLTAGQAYPAFESLMLNAQTRVAMSFRVFEPLTTLRSPEGLRIGKDWVDLIAHTLARGVAIDLVISDFDVIVRADYHARATRCLRQVIAAGEMSGRPDLLRVSTSLHPAKIGLLPSVALWPRARGNLKRIVAELNAKTPAARAREWALMPQLHDLLDRDDDDEGRVARRSWKMPRLTQVTHHQKLAVADGKRLYIGGLDLNERRYDTTRHERPASETWHDLQLLIEGPIAAAAEAHLRSFRDVTEGASPPKTPGLLRTLSRARRDTMLRMSPHSVLREIVKEHRVQVRKAQRLIYLETQFMRDKGFARDLARRALAEPDLGLILILPAAPDDIAFQGNQGPDARYGEYLQAKCIDILQRAFGDRVFIGSPGQKRAAESEGRATIYGAPLVYLHAKVSIFDTRAAIVSSANLNGRSLHWDTEAGVLLDYPDQVADLRDQCFAHWLTGPVSDDLSNPATAVAAWRDRARANIALPPSDRRGFILPYASGPARRFGRSLPGIPEEMV
ncbi:phospholipase D-like domain-containing protein [Jannaschia donghaensis]|uniref:Phospholipase D n=1 Tax=Jannaschia donghaensis TaxID=420998 RepID=A0A0M6YCK4_9RHOB|nr:phospholipase D-like domain-containing protein [Jannaschia donghaensis]CTQ48091.1 cardiolipin synthetase [Jannaschia donghaensis]